MKGQELYLFFFCLDVQRFEIRAAVWTLLDTQGRFADRTHFVCAFYAFGHKKKSQDSRSHYK